MTVNYCLEAVSLANVIDTFAICKSHREIIADMYLEIVVIQLRTTASHPMVNLLSIPAMYLDVRTLEGNLILVRDHMERWIHTFICFLNLSDTSNAFYIHQWFRLCHGRNSFNRFFAHLDFGSRSFHLRSLSQVNRR